MLCNVRSNQFIISYFSLYKSCMQNRTYCKIQTHFVKGLWVCVLSKYVLLNELVSSSGYMHLGHKICAHDEKFKSILTILPSKSWNVSLKHAITCTTHAINKWRKPFVREGVFRYRAEGKKKKWVSKLQVFTMNEIWWKREKKKERKSCNKIAWAFNKNFFMLLKHAIQITENQSFDQKSFIAAEVDNIEYILQWTLFAKTLLVEDINNNIN